MYKLNFDETISTKIYPLSYTHEILKNIKLISFGVDDAFPFGSFTYNVQKYPADIDLHQDFTDGNTIELIIHSFKKKLLGAIINIINLKLHYMIEFKMGLDKRFIIDIGHLDNGIYKQNTNNIIEKSNLLYDNGLLNNDDLDFISKYLYKDDIDSYDQLFNFFRNKYILRWSDSEILRGYKNLVGGIKKTIVDALHDITHVKIDMICLINNRFVEVTNFFYLITNDGFIINFGLYADDPRFFSLPKQTLKKEIEKLFYSNYYFNPFKGAKRYWALARQKRDKTKIFALTPLITGDLSFLYMLKSEIDTILTLLEKLKNPPILQINNQIDEIKIRLNYIFEIKDKEILFNSLNDAYSINDISKKIYLLKFVKKNISAILNKYTMDFMDIKRLLPISSDYLPDHLSYFFF